MSAIPRARRVDVQVDVELPRPLPQVTRRPRDLRRDRPVVGQYRPTLQQYVPPPHALDASALPVEVAKRRGCAPRLLSAGRPRALFEPCPIPHRAAGSVQPEEDVVDADVLPEVVAVRDAQIHPPADVGEHLPGHGRHAVDVVPRLDGLRGEAVAIRVEVPCDDRQAFSAAAAGCAVFCDPFLHSFEYYPRLPRLPLVVDVLVCVAGEGEVGVGDEYVPLFPGRRTLPTPLPAVYHLSYPLRSRQHLLRLQDLQPTVLPHQTAHPVGPHLFAVGARPPFGE
mmetsp:Transcript_19300/g.45179  ORF Transcript_19300/g.45179 Transcript_19300/m.45179 type:complete len:281 (+) Transcript_19300:76-918(+)